MNLKGNQGHGRTWNKKRMGGNGRKTVVMCAILQTHFKRERIIPHKGRSTFVLHTVSACACPRTEGSHWSIFQDNRDSGEGLVYETSQIVFLVHLCPWHHTSMMQHWIIVFIKGDLHFIFIFHFIKHILLHKMKCFNCKILTHTHNVSYSPPITHSSAQGFPAAPPWLLPPSLASPTLSGFSRPPWLLPYLLGFSFTSLRLLYLHVSDFLTL